MRTTKELIEGKIQRLARILSDRYFIDVVFEGNECKTDGKTIYLPSLPDFPDIEEDPAKLTAFEEKLDKVITLMEGHVDHEVSHLLFSDFTTLRKVKDPLTKLFLGITEDIRAESKMVQMWRGSKTNMDESAKIITRDKIYPRFDEIEPIHQLAEGLLVMASGDEEMIDEFPKPSLLEDLAPVQPVLDVIKDLPTSDHSLALAKYLMEAFGLEFKPPAGTSMAAMEEMLEEIMETMMSAGASGRAGMMPGSGKGEPSIKEITEAITEAMKEEMEGVLKEHEIDPEVAKEKAEEVLKAMEKSETIEHEASGLYKHYAVKGKSFYAPYTTKDDVIKVMKANAKHKAEYQKTLAEVRKSVGVMIRQLRMAMASVKRCEISRGKLWGELSPPDIPRFLVTGDPRVFRRKTYAETTSARVSLLVDLSGSMGGTKVREARKAVIAFGEFCHAIRVPFEIMGFTSVSFHTEFENRQRTKGTPAYDTFTRWGELKIEIYKEFHEQWKRVASRIMTMKAQCHNYDGEAVAIAVRRLQLSAKPGERRILFVFSDGYPEQEFSQFQPHGQEYLRRVVKQSMSAGIELIGIGICSDAVSHYYPDHVVLNNAADLSRTELQKLKEYLVQQRRQKRTSSAAVGA
jgi:hypothetical protein